MNLQVDLNPRYPECYDLDNIAVVASVTRTREFDAVFSNYGARMVDLAAASDNPRRAASNPQS
ncbi:MAG: hypothetical protein FJ403_24370 [Verrucomicrobia bacterium]|nr:hypothetical protein [Verrucomicrobiota bacterium]